MFPESGDAARLRAATARCTVIGLSSRCFNAGRLTAPAVVIWALGTSHAACGVTANPFFTGIGPGPCDVPRRMVLPHYTAP